MRIRIDTTTATLEIDEAAGTKHLPLYSKAGFEILSELWLKVGWDQRYSYTFTWLGQPIIQLPEDLLRLQEVVCHTKPDVIVETGVAHGGSLVFHATICHALGIGRVIGIDVEIRQENRRALETHRLSPLISLIEGDSATPATVAHVKSLIGPTERVLVILDSDHSARHVLDELNAYAPLVTEGSYIVVTDGVMATLADTPHGSPKWKTDGPLQAIATFLAAHDHFVQEQPAWGFNESALTDSITYWPSAYLRRR